MIKFSKPATTKVIWTPAKDYISPGRAIHPEMKYFGVFKFTFIKMLSGIIMKLSYRGRSGLITFVRTRHLFYRFRQISFMISPADRLWRRVIMPKIWHFHRKRLGTMPVQQDLTSQSVTRRKKKWWWLWATQKGTYTVLFSTFRACSHCTEKFCFVFGKTLTNLQS